MCGIYCLLRRYKQYSNGESVLKDSVLGSCAEYLKHRGPDGFSDYNVCIEEQWRLNFVASVLWMQGSTLTMQPSVYNGKHILLWNGDIFNGSVVNKGNSSDTETLGQCLAEAEDILSVLAGVRGPYSFIYLDIQNKRLYFGRDRLGRHSLLWSSDTEGGLILTSVGRKNMLNFQEVPVIGMFMVDMNVKDILKIVVFPWSDIPAEKLTPNMGKEFKFRIEVAAEIIPSPLVPCKKDPLGSEYSLQDVYNEGVVPADQIEHFMNALLSDFRINQSLEKLLGFLKDSVQVRVETQPGKCKKCLKWDVAHSYFNHIYKHPKSECQEELRHCPSLTIKYHTYPANRSVKSSAEVPHVNKLQNEANAVPKSESLCTFPLNLNGDACSISVNPIKPLKQCKHTKIGILFSGGLDSAILAALANEFVPLNEPIDLLNVAFENQNKKSKEGNKKKFMKAQANSSEKDCTFLVPDRISGKRALSDLKKLYPKRQWNLVQVDVTQEELARERKNIISDLIYPLNTVLDESLGCALWFASRGKGYIDKKIDENSCHSSPGEKTYYNSPARVLLLGMGADELFGGYRRHRTVLEKNGWSHLREELELDLARISSRNLGRDDRIISDHGCQGRFPYLDESVVSYVTSLEPWHRCCPTSVFPPGVGDKLLLRMVAWKLGLRYSASLPKRAFQFGSKVANPKECGSDVSLRL